MLREFMSLTSNDHTNWDAEKGLFSPWHSRQIKRSNAPSSLRIETTFHSFIHSFIQKARKLVKLLTISVLSCRNIEVAAVQAAACCVWCDTMTPAPAVHNLENSTVQKGLVHSVGLFHELAYNDAASIAPTLIRLCTGICNVLSEECGSIDCGRRTERATPTCRSGWPTQPRNSRLQPHQQKRLGMSLSFSLLNV